MKMRFDKVLSCQEIYANGDELATIMGYDRDADGNRVRSYPESSEVYVTTIDDPVLVTDHHKISQLDPIERDTVFALLGSPVRYTVFDDTSLRFEQGRYPGLWGPSIDTLLFAKGLAMTDLQGVKEAVEVGSGSGFISKYLLEHSPDLERMTLVDLDPTAMLCAQENIDDMRTRYVTGDATKSMGEERYDLIVCNPPYIPRRSSIDDNPYEGTGLLSYLLDNAHQLLEPGGSIITNISSLCRPHMDIEGRYPSLHVDEITSMDVPLKVYNVLNDTGWREYLVDGGFIEEGLRDGYHYWQNISINRITPVG